MSFIQCVSYRDNGGEKMKSISKCVGILLLLMFVGVMLSGCTPEKAAALSSAATQFKEKSLEAVDAIASLMDKELEPPPRSNSEINEEFAKNILAVSDDKEITTFIVELANDPYSVVLDDDYKARRKKFRNNLRKSYIAFANIFEELEGGSFFAKKAVKASAPIASNLTLQMAAYAEAITNNPPKLLQYRSAKVVEIAEAKASTTLDSGAKKSRLFALNEEYNAIKTLELELQKSTVKKCLDASLLGMYVGRLIDEYEKLSLKDLHYITGRVLTEVSSITGEDLSKLKLKSEEVFAKIESDPILKDMADMALEEANEAMAKKHTTSGVSGGSGDSEES